ncbi:glycine zipper domain-containing protein [Candidatus Parabeggiatoa sp. HSG14]|nr:glycine zipper domain-containing protein [Thiotrichales bacterium HSG14]
MTLRLYTLRLLGPAGAAVGAATGAAIGHALGSEKDKSDKE